MQGKDILRLKRSATQITSDEDICITDDFLLDLSRKIFVHHYNKKYQHMEISLYQTESLKHPQCSNIIVTPHFVRDDGVVIYLQLKHKNNYLKMVSEDVIHVSMEILKTKNASVFTIELEPSINPNDMKSILNINIAKSYVGLVEKKFHYSSDIAKNYVSMFNTKKTRTIINTLKTLETISTDNKNIAKGFERNEWVSASKTRNYALKDTLIDWLDICYDNSSENKKNPVNNKKSNEYDFTKYIMSKGTQFESNIVDLIKKKVREHEFITICKDMQNFDNRVLEYEQLTKDNILKGTPIIYQALLMNRTGPLNYSYGMPDLLVRSDYLSKIVTKDPYDKKTRMLKAPNLKGPHHYVIVDIKFTTLELCADGIRIRNSGSIPAYKCQLYIYNHALGVIQGYEPAVSFILGRKYKYECKGKYYYGNGCFDRFGHIEYNKWDKAYVDETMNAIKWIKTLRTEGKEWKLLPEPSVPQLYPNMSSVSDTPWNNFKHEYANKIGEITLLWNCGVKNREIAHKNGVYTIWDDKCNSATVGVNGAKQAPILDEIIKINKKRKFDDVMDRIHMNINKEVDNYWLEPCKLRISVDFETINNVFDDFTELPRAQEKNYLFMIGIGYKVVDEPVEYKMFLISELSKNAEFQIIYQFYKFLREITDKHLGKNMPIPPLYHWGHIERSFFTGLCARLEKTIGDDIENDLELMRTKLVWYDLSETFKNNPIVINGCFKFGLKEVAGRLFELGLVQSSWKNSDSTCADGNTAMVMAQRAYQSSRQNSVSITQSPIIKEIMEYNKIDCVVIHEIVEFMLKKAKQIKSKQPESNSKRRRTK
ncbi:hypothetical protein QJ856_gp0984 [Tupanvirus deep ocean]|uniref:Uncharacterized protein n=2 Tax=Tupanvirus TaxID=2094720 RepID=A0AC62A820_9VIRU|nr:hypothetical protein QJ856_gp0984 [Tupanvirus deep ocean]QKU33773.1 hypothetical protein [Tupanvirus deep ocean]